jgi:RNA-binding motif X-linked protein 2
MNEGDIVAVFSQFGEVVDCWLARDHKTGISKCFAYLAYENQLSTVLAVDNFNG